MMNNPKLDNSRENVGKRDEHKIVQGCRIWYLDLKKNIKCLFLVRQQQVDMKLFKK